MENIIKIETEHQEGFNTRIEIDNSTTSKEFVIHNCYPDNSETRKKGLNKDNESIEITLHQDPLKDRFSQKLMIGNLVFHQREFQLLKEFLNQ